MDKAKARKMYELADQLSKVDAKSLTETQLAEYQAMVSQLKSALESTNQPEDIEEVEQIPHTNYDVVKLGGKLNVDPRLLRTAIMRGMQGSPTRADISTLADAFLNLVKNSDDTQIQNIANLIKSGNPKGVPQESTSAIAERNAFIDALRQAKKGEKFTAGGKEYTKTTDYGQEEVKENIDSEAYDRLKRIFDFSNFKG